MRKTGCYMGGLVTALVIGSCNDERADPTRATHVGATGKSSNEKTMSRMGEIAARARPSMFERRAEKVTAPGQDDNPADLPGGNQGEMTIEDDSGTRHGDGNGRNVVVGFNDSRGFPDDPLDPVSVSGFMWSSDGGRTFTDGGQLPVDNAEEFMGLILPQVFGDPDVKYLGNCNFIYSSILFAKFQEVSVVQTLGFHLSSDCGQTWHGPFEIPSASNPNGGVDDAGNPFDAADKEFIDVDRATGRVIMSWSNFTPFAEGGVQITSTYSDNVLDGADAVWSPPVVVSQRAEDGQSSIPRFAGRNAYVAWRAFPGFNQQKISFARSTNGGASFEPAIDIAPAFASPDQVLGNDRINSSPSMAVDLSNGRNKGSIYVTYSPNDSGDGADVVVQRSTDRGRTFKPAVVLNSRPGADRSQWFPWVTVDEHSGRVFVYYYDQGPSASGDRVQTSFTYSDDGGVHWSRPARLSSRPWNAGWGNDTGQPNLGDYNQAIVNDQGAFLASYAFSHPVGFTDGQPEVGMTVPEPQIPIAGFVEQLPRTSVDLQGVTAAEASGGSNGNGFLDAGETFKVRFAVRNFVTNPLNADTINAALGLVQSRTPGANVSFGVTVFPRMRPGETRSSLLDVTVRLDAGFNAGQDVELALIVIGNGAPETLFATIHTGTPVATDLLSTNFDAGAPGWAVQFAAGAVPVLWSIAPPGFCGSTSPAAFHPNDDNGSRWSRLFSPIFAVPANAEWVEVEFDVCYNTEDDPGFNVLAFDGFFLRVTDRSGPPSVLRSVLAEAFAQDFTTGDIFHYPKHFPRSNDPAYFEDMSAWAGDSGGFRHVKMRLPGMAGTRAQLRFEYTQDGVATCRDSLGDPTAVCGVMLDNVVVRSLVAN